MAAISNIKLCYDRIRAILGVDEIDLPNEIIEYPEYGSNAQRYIKSKVTNWETLNAEQKDIFDSCILYKTAELLIPYCQATVNNVKAEQIPHSKVEYFEINTNDKYTIIRDCLDEMISQITDNNFSFHGFDIS